MAHNQRRHCGPIQAARRKVKYSQQVVITEANRRRKRLKHMKRQPNDLQTKKLL